MNDLTPYLSQIAQLPLDRQRELLEILERFQSASQKKMASSSFLGFVKHMWPSFIEGSHHRIMAKVFDDVVSGKKKRIILNMPPRHTKSEFASIHLPAYFLGKYPDKKIIMASHTAELATGFGRKVKALVGRKEFQELFPGVTLSADNKAAGRWATNHNGEYFAVGVGGALAGRGADLCVTPDMPVLTKDGYRPASSIRVGDMLYGISGYGRVRHVIRSRHRATVSVNGLEFSDHHPVWIVGKGWVSAKDIVVDDGMLGLSIAEHVVINCSRRVRAIYEKIYAGIQHLGAYASALREPEGGELQGVRRSWHQGMRPLEEIRRILRGYGASPFTAAYAGQDGQRRGLLSGKLPLGERFRTGEQSFERRKDFRIRGNEDDHAMVQSNGAYAGHDISPHQGYGNGPGRSSEGTEDEPHSEGRRAEKRWRGSWKIRFLGRRREADGLQPKGYFQRLGRSLEDGIRFLLGVRRVKFVARHEHEPREFLNFHVDGHNTFFVGSSLVHNCVIDDPHNEQQAILGAHNPSLWTDTLDWYETGPRQRLQPGGAIIVVATRWSKLDLPGQLIKKQQNNEKADKWEVIELPAILPSGKSLWPEFWSEEELEKTKNAIPLHRWLAQYQQTPTSEEGSLIKREWWQDWPSSKPPKCDVIVQSWDTAYTTGTRADYSACTTWGIFYNEETERNAIILLDAERGKSPASSGKRRSFTRSTSRISA